MLSPPLGLARSPSIDKDTPKNRRTYTFIQSRKIQKSENEAANSFSVNSNHRKQKAKEREKEKRLCLHPLACKNMCLSLSSYECLQLCPVHAPLKIRTILHHLPPLSSSEHSIREKEAEVKSEESEGRGAKPTGQMAQRSYDNATRNVILCGK